MKTNWIRRAILTLTLWMAALALPVSGAEPKTIWPEADWPRATTEQMGMDPRLLEQARDYARTGEGSGLIIRHGHVVMEWGDLKQRYDLKSTTKSFGATALGLALGDGLVKRLNDPVHQYDPSIGVPPESNAETGWTKEITFFHLATQTAGFDKVGGYTELLFRPGTQWSYSDGGPNWLAECLTLLYKRDLNDVMFERVFGPIGIQPSDLRWRRNAYRPHEINGIPRREFGSGISANVNAMARLGYLYLHDGRWKDQQILPASFVTAAMTTPEAIRDLSVFRPEEYPDASRHYGLLWWNNADGTLPDVPTSASWTWGLYDSLILVMPDLDLVVARAGRSMTQLRGSRYREILGPFLTPIAQSVREKTEAPYPTSALIEKVDWAPESEIVRRAAGSDNWPLAWMDDGALFGAYGDGFGFEPKLRNKLSMGFVRIEGGPEDFRGANIRSASGETRGDGAKGKKASGLLMVDGVLYLWARNADNAQLAWSKDRGAQWTWSDWKFSDGFGCPAFLNAGPNNSDVRDDYVYTYSPDIDTAYEPADRIALARVKKDQITERAAWEFFEQLGDDGQPVWTRDIKQRGGVFKNPGRCGRNTVNWAPALKRYLLVQTHGGDTRFQGGLGIYEAPTPWGPWSTVYFTTEWDVGPGETASLPTKWMSDDGRTLYLVFSGDDSFSVRKLSLAHKARSEQ